MTNKLMTFLLYAASVLVSFPAFTQTQSCPVNINFSTGDLSSWSAATGLVGNANQSYPGPNTGVSVIPEYSIGTTGIKVITSTGNDLYGGFPTIPVINGYAYNYSVQIGSAATSFDLHSSSPNPGGFTRSVTYTVNVPAGSPLVPYTMTYAYAMVLENGTHNSNEQPLFKATLSVHDSIITCASPQYYLPTFNDGNSSGGGSATGATLDTATALANGFTNSPVLFLSHGGAAGNNGTYLQDVWTKSWTEVTFDLSPYRGQQVKLSFESDNCRPGAHFAYAYIALRNTCEGLEISGNPVACTNNTSVYSVPALAGAAYTWTVPAGWTINSGANTNAITVTAGTAGGFITAREVNGCADMKDTIAVTASPPTVAGNVISDNRVCAGANSTLLNLNGQVGNILSWVSSTDGQQWNAIANTSNSYTVQDLATTTIYRAVIQNGSSCRIDTSTAATILVDPKSVGGILSPANTNVCANQTTNSIFTLTGHTGSISNWQISHDNTTWNNFNPVKTDSVYIVGNINSNTEYRSIVKSGVCPPDTSSVATIHFINEQFPDAVTDPAFSEICYGKSATLNAQINIGTSYIWTPSGTLTNQGNGIITSIPRTINAVATPPRTTDYILTVYNGGCPNPLIDTFHVAVTPPINVFAGNDTSIVANQPLQLNALVNDSAANIFTWTPGTGLSATDIYNPIALLGPSASETMTYIVRATNAAGCYGEDNITVTVFKTGPDIFVPSAFTPNGDGLNDVIRPICVGIRQFNFFRVYNRWGQLVFSTSEFDQGWDGMIKGAQQSTANFVYMVQGVDYLGNTIFKKGNIVLVR